MDVTLHMLRHGVVRVEDAEASLYASIDIVCDKVGAAPACGVLLYVCVWGGGLCSVCVCGVQEFEQSTCVYARSLT